MEISLNYIFGDYFFNLIFSLTLLSLEGPTVSGSSAATVTNVQYVPFK